MDICKLIVTNCELVTWITRAQLTGTYSSRHLLHAICKPRELPINPDKNRVAMKTPESSLPSISNPYFTIAILEHDDALRESLVTWVTDMGYTAVPFATAAALLSALEAANYSLFLLNWVLPDMQGIDLLRQLRSDGRIDAPIILCTARGAEADVAETLSIGADDFIVKPVRRNELAARISATLRRAHPGQADTGKFTVPPYSIDLGNRMIHADGQAIELQNREFALAVMLFRNLNGVVLRSRIIHTIWGGELTETSRSLDTHISRVRRKLGLRPERGLILQSVYGLGYRLQAVAQPPFQPG